MVQLLRERERGRERERVKEGEREREKERERTRNLAVGHGIHLHHNVIILTFDIEFVLHVLLQSFLKLFSQLDISRHQ